MPINPSINDIMREAFPFMQEILSPAELVTFYCAYDFLPPQILLHGSHSVKSKELEMACERKIYLIGKDNQIIAYVPDGEIVPGLECDSCPIASSSCFAGYSELLYTTILSHLDSDIQYVVDIHAVFRIKGFEKNLDKRKVEIFEVDPDTLEKNCQQAKTELELRKMGKRQRDMN